MFMAEMPLKGERTSNMLHVFNVKPEKKREFRCNKVGQFRKLFYFQNIIDRMNTEFKPKLITLRSSGEKIPDQDPAVTSDQVDDIVNSSQKNLEGVQSALQLRKFRYIRRQNISIKLYQTC